MSKSDKKFEKALEGKKIPILTLDNQWHQLVGKVEPDRQVAKLQEELNELLKRQGKARTEIRKIKALKKKLMDEIMELAEDAASGKNKRAENKVSDNKRLIVECNEKLTEYEDEILELPGKMDQVNRELMLKTMEICYDVLKKQSGYRRERKMDFGDARRAEGAPDPETGAGAGEPGAVHLHAQYFGVDVIDIFDMAYLNKEN